MDGDPGSLVDRTSERTRRPGAVGSLARAPAHAGRAEAEVDTVRLAYALFVATAVFIVLTLADAKLLADPDTLWHVRVGADIWANRAVPTTDAYSHTWLGEPWIAKEWLSQVLLYLAHAAGGWSGVVLLVSASLALTGFLLSRELAADLRPALALGLTLLVMIFVFPTYLARPHNLTFPLMVIWTGSLLRAAHETRGPPWSLLAVIWLWANMHAGFTLGFVVALFAFLDLLGRVRLTRPKLLARWIGFGVLCPLVTVVHPYGVDAILATFTIAVGNAAVPYVGEWDPFDARSLPLHEIALLLVLLFLLISGFRTSIGRAGLFLLTLHMFLIHKRFVYAFAFLAPLALATDIGAQFPSVSARRWAAESRDGFERAVIRGFRGVAAACAIAFLAAALILLRSPAVAPPPETMAGGALAFAEANGLTGPVLNSYHFGGPLISRGIPTFIDGRTDQLFLGDFIETFEATKEADGRDPLRRLIERYGVEWALLVRGDPRAVHLDGMDDWRRVYQDDHALVYIRERS